jgi:glutathione-regulated potassium-efflux system ancillary protein KefC
MLAQGGEFGFVVLQAAGGAALVPASESSFLLAAIAISMLLTPLVMVWVDRVLAPRLAARARTASPAMDEIGEEQTAPILILGFGRYGQIVARLINAEGLAATVLDHDAEQVASVRKFGWPAFYGDATRLDLLRTAGAGTARVLVLAIDDVEQSVEVARLAREHFPQLTLVARARNVTHYYELRKLGVDLIERETLDSALMSGRSVLELCGFRPHQARNLALRFRAHSIELLETLRAHQDDEASLIAAAKTGRRQLEEAFARERHEALDRKSRAGWDAGAGEAQPQRVADAAEPPPPGARGA